MVVFSRHDVLNSPPFSGIDLTVCRNVLIYLTPASQARALLNLAFSLKINGTLALGPSESVGVLKKYFEDVDRKWRIFQKKRNAEVVMTSQWNCPRARQVSAVNAVIDRVEKAPLRQNLVLNLFEILYPNSLLLSESGQVLALFGAGKQLITTPADGVFSTTLDHLMETSRALILRSAMTESRDMNRVIELEHFAQLQSTTSAQEVRSFSLRIRYCENPEKGHFFLCELFEHSGTKPLEPIKKTFAADEQISEALKLELERIRLELESVVQELESTNEELQTSNEELIASNEDLQSTNEELNSVNEELYTLNSELQQKIEQVTVAKDDLKNLLETTEIGVIYLDITGRIRRVNQKVESEFFIRGSDVGRSVFELDFGVHLEPFRDKLLASAQETLSFDVISKSSNHYHGTIHPYIDTFSKHVGYVVSLVETNEASERERFLNEAQSEAKIGGWVLELDSQKTKWTRQVYDIYEIPVETPTNVAQGLTQYAPHDQELLAQNIQECARTGRPFEGLHSFTTARGNLIWVRVTGKPVYDQLHRVTKIRGIIQDVTSSKLLQERLVMALETSQLGIWEWELKSNRLFWDAKMISIFGVKANSGETSFEEWVALIHHEDREHVRDQLRRGRSQETDLKIEFRINRGDEVRHLRLGSKVYSDLNGLPSKMIGVVQDITEKVRADQRVEEERRISFQNSKLASLGELAAGVGHEINNPLAIIMGSQKSIVESLRGHQALTPKLEASFQRTEAAALRIRDIVNGLRTFARVSPADFSVHSVSSIVEGVIGLVKGIYEKEGISLELRTPAQESHVKVHFGQIQQALMNLISNARDALQNQTIKRIEVVISNPSLNEVEISVVDTGCGISEDHLPKIFDNFFTTKAIGKGTGLGLSLSKKMIEESGGRIEVESKVGVGTCFRLTFGLVQNSEVSIQELPKKDLPQERPEVDLGKLIVLLVEDEDDLREIVQSDLEQMGFEVISFRSGIEALEFLEQNFVNIIITDLQMPEMSGVDFLISAEKLVDASNGQTAAFILLGDVSGQRVKRLQEMKTKIFQGVIEKPYQFENFKNKLTDLALKLKGHLG